MSTDRDTTRIVRSWLDDGVTALPDRVLDAVLDEVPATPQRRATWWPVRRPPTMNTYLRYGVVAAGLLIAVIVGAQLIGSRNITSPGPTPTPQPSPTAEPTPIAFRTGDQSSGGRYLIQLPHAPVDAVMTLDVGWTSGGWFINGTPGAVMFYAPENINTDACDQSGTLPSPAVGPTVDDFLAALDAQQNSEMSAPTDVTIDGVVAKRIELRPSADAPCDLVLWWSEPCCGDPAYRGANVGDVNPDTVWILQVEGQRVVVVGYWDHSQPESGAAIEDVISSVDFTAR